MDVASHKGWSLTGFLSYLNPLRSFSSTSQEGPVDANAARKLTARGEEVRFISASSIKFSMC